MLRLATDEVKMCKRIQVEALIPVQCGPDCGKNHFCMEEDRWPTGLGGMGDIQQFVRRESLNTEVPYETHVAVQRLSSHVLESAAASGGQRRPSSYSTVVDRCSPCTCVPLSTRTRHTYFGTEILYSSKGVANTAIRKSSSAAFGLIPPSRSLSIWNHLPIPTRTVC